MSVKDMYADLEKIEARGKRKKEKRGGLFSSFSKKEEPDAEAPAQETPKPAPSPKPVAEPAKPEPVPEKKAPEPAPVASPPTPAAKPEPAVERKMPEPVKEVPVHASPPPNPVMAAPTAPPEPVKAEPVIEKQPPKTDEWKPLSGGKLKKAEEELLAYKKWLNKGYKSGVMSKEQCTLMVRAKEAELGLRPPE